MDADVDDATLVATASERGLRGQLAFEQLVDRHQSWLVRLLMHFLGSRSDAEDVAQDAFVRAFLSIGDCSDGKLFRAWLRVIARRLAFNHRRDARTRAQYEEKSAALKGTSASSEAGGLEGRDLLEQALSQLSYPYREIVVLRFVEELPLKEIASVLEIGNSAAKMRLARARGEFARAYETLGGKHGPDNG